MKLLDKYFKIQKEVYEYFGYNEDWVAIPLDDSTEYYWKLDQNENGGGQVHFADTEEELCDQNGNYYINQIYTQRFLPKWVYRGEEYTMICVDTQTDGNKFIAIFDNTKERNNIDLLSEAELWDRLDI